MVPNSALCVIVVIFIASSCARPDQTAAVDTNGENDEKSRPEELPAIGDLDKSGSTEVPRDKRALGVILQGLVSAFGYTPSPISYASLANPTPRPPPQKPQPPTMAPPKPTKPMAPASPPARQRETLRFTGVVNFGNNSDLLGHLRRYERIFHGNATTTKAPPPATPRPPPPPPPPRPSLGKPALLTPYFVPIPLPLAPNLVTPLPATAPRIVNEKEQIYTKQEHSENYEGESKELSDERDVRKDPPRLDADRDTYIDEPQWKQKQRQREEDERNNYREEQHEKDESSEENENIQEKNKYREEEIAERERKNTKKPQSEETNASLEEDTSEDDKKGSAEGDDKYNNYEDDDEKNSDQDDDQKNNYKNDDKNSYEDNEKSASKEEEEDSPESEKYAKKPEESEEGDDGYKPYQTPHVPSIKIDHDNREFGALTSDYDRFKEHFDFTPKKTPPPSKQFNNRLPIRVFDDPFALNGGLRNSYGESLEQNGRVDDSVADYFQRYKDPETGLFDSRKIQNIQGPREKDPWWQNHQATGPGLDPLERIRHEYAPPAGTGYEEYNLEDDKAGEQKVLKEETEDEESDEGVEPAKKEYSPANAQETAENEDDDEEAQYGDKLKSSEKEDDEEEPAKEYGNKTETRKNEDDEESTEQYENEARAPANEDAEESRQYTDKSRTHNNRDEEEVKRYIDKPRTYHNGDAEEAKRYTDKPRTYHNGDGEGPLRQYERQLSRKKSPLSRYKYKADEKAEPTQTAYTSINALGETRRTNIKDRSGESTEAKKISPSNNAESDDVSKKLQKFENFAVKNPLPFKGFDFIKYSPYFRPIQVAYEPKKLERTANRILSYHQHGSAASGQDDSGSDELFRHKNVASNIRLNPGGIGSDEYLVKRPYLKPIQLVYEPEKLLRTANKILAYHKSREDVEQKKNRHEGKEKQESRSPHKANENREANHSDDDRPSNNYSEQNNREENNSEEDTAPSKNYSEQEDREANNSEEDAAPSKNYSEQEDGEENDAEEDTSSSKNYSEQEDRRIDNSDEDAGSSRSHSEQKNREADNSEADNSQPKNRNEQEIGLPERLTSKQLHEGESKEIKAWPAPFDHTFDSTERTKVVRVPKTKYSSKIRDADIEPTYETPAILEFHSTGPIANSPRGSDVTPTSETRTIDESRASGPTEGHSRGSARSPSYGTRNAKKTRVTDRTRNRSRDLDVSPTNESPSIVVARTSAPTRSHSRSSTSSPTHETRNVKRTRVTDRTRDRPRDLDVSPTNESPSIEKSRDSKPGESLSDKTRRRPQSESRKGTSNNDDLEKRRKESPKASRYDNRKEAESRKSRDDAPSIRLQIYQPRDFKDYSETDRYRPAELRDSEVQKKSSGDENLNDRQTKEPPESTAQAKKFEDPESAHEFFGLSRDDYNLRENGGSQITIEPAIEQTTTPFPSDEKELIGLLIIPHDPNYQQDVALTKFTTEPETETEQVKVNEYRNKVATLKITELKQTSPNGPVQHDKRREVERRNELERKMTEILDNLKTRLLLE